MFAVLLATAHYLIALKRFRLMKNHKCLIKMDLLEVLRVKDNSVSGKPFEQSNLVSIKLKIV